ncbi:ricin-type beta-trefoil lectin domain protein [Streptomyces sp. NPDC102259]|uniref:ricin-type beta-trefoil lectin domain protein n=1 Tax=Streptomyces sp. NPDC102259 TaxID=3366148 RepID=UPI00382CC9D5
MTEARMASVRIVEVDPVVRFDAGSEPPLRDLVSASDLLGAHTAATASDAASDTDTDTDTGTGMGTGTRAAWGRSKKGVVAGAAVVGAILIAVPFLVDAFGDDSGERGSASGATADSDLGGHGTGDAPGAFGSGSPSTDSTSHLTSVDSTGNTSDEGVEGEGAGEDVGDKGGDGDSSSTKSTDTTKSSTTGTSSSGQATTGTGGSTTVSGVSIRSHASGKCIDVSGGESKDGVPLDILGCAGAARMSWTFASDGTVRALGRCMDVAWGSTDNGAQIQLADCNGEPAQQFRLNDAHDLVNQQADKCVDVTDARTANGTGLQIWDCTGADNQKWSKG